MGREHQYGGGKVKSEAEILREERDYWKEQAQKKDEELRLMRRKAMAMVVTASEMAGYLIPSLSKEERQRILKPERG